VLGQLTRVEVQTWREGKKEGLGEEEGGAPDNDISA